MAGAAAWLDRVTPRWLNMRDVGHVIIYALLALWSRRRRWQRLLDALFGREHRGGQRAVGRIQRAMRAALSAVAGAGRTAAPAVPVRPAHRTARCSSCSAAFATLAFLFWHAIMRLHDLLEGKCGVARATFRR